MRPLSRVSAFIFAEAAAAISILGCSHATRIITVPDGAEITINGAKVGHAPLVFDQRSGPPGRSYEVRAELAGYPAIVRREGARICPTPANMILDSLAVGFFFGFCMRDEYVYDFTTAQATPVPAAAPVSAPPAPPPAKAPAAGSPRK